MIFALYIYIVEPENTMGILMFLLGIVILYVRGFFMQKTKAKIIFLVCLWIGLQCMAIRFGTKIFLAALIDDFAYAFVFMLGIFFIYAFINKSMADEKILNVAKFPGLKESDAEMLRRVLDNQQYKVIAIDLKLKEGSVRNRLNRVYDILGVGDRVGFITSYKGFEVSYVPDPESAMNEESDEMESPEAESSVLLS